MAAADIFIYKPFSTWRWQCGGCCKPEPIRELKSAPNITLQAVKQMYVGYVALDPFNANGVRTGLAIVADATAIPAGQYRLVGPDEGDAKDAITELSSEKSFGPFTVATGGAYVAALRKSFNAGDHTSFMFVITWIAVALFLAGTILLIVRWIKHKPTLEVAARSIFFIMAIIGVIITVDATTTSK